MGAEGGSVHEAIHLVRCPGSGTCGCGCLTGCSRVSEHHSLHAESRVWRGVPLDADLGTYSPYTVFFDYGDGNEHDWSSTTLSGYYQSYTFWPCNTTRFEQELGVRDSHYAVA